MGPVMSYFLCIYIYIYILYTHHHTPQDFGEFLSPLNSAGGASDKWGAPDLKTELSSPLNSGMEPWTDGALLMRF